MCFLPFIFSSQNDIKAFQADLISKLLKTFSKRNDVSLFLCDLCEFTLSTWHRCDLPSTPISQTMASENCNYEFIWNTHLLNILTALVGLKELHLKEKDRSLFVNCLHTLKTALSGNLKFSSLVLTFVKHHGTTVSKEH